MSKISVIMGVYNCKNKKILLNSVNSIINQTFLDWEFLICNDGSTDDTLEFLKKIEKMDSRIKIISYTENHGLHYALNTCLKECKGEYIARQDDDDISYRDRLNKQLKFLEAHRDYDIVGSIADIYDDSGIWGEYKVTEKPDKESFLWNSPFLHPSIIIRKCALLDVSGYRVAKETRRCEDYDLFMRLYAKNHKGYNIQEKLYKYRIINNKNKKHRPMKYRIDESIVRYQGFKELGILVQGIPYIIKPLLIGLIPARIFSWIKEKQYKNKANVI